MPYIDTHKWAKVVSAIVIGMVVCVLAWALKVSPLLIGSEWWEALLYGAAAGASGAGLYDLVKAIGSLFIGNYIPVYTSLPITITNNHKLYKYYICWVKSSLGIWIEKPGGCSSRWESPFMFTLARCRSSVSFNDGYTTIALCTWVRMHRYDLFPLFCLVIMSCLRTIQTQRFINAKETDTSARIRGSISTSGQTRSSRTRKCR